MERDVIQVCKTIMVGVLFTGGAKWEEASETGTISLMTVWLTRIIAPHSLKPTGRVEARHGTARH